MLALPEPPNPALMTRMLLPSSSSHDQDAAAQLLSSQVHVLTAPKALPGMSYHSLSLLSGSQNPTDPSCRDFFHSLSVLV